MEERNALEPSMPEAAVQYWWVVLATVLAGTALGLALATFVFSDSKATASILIEDPSSNRVFETGTAADPERYLASQVAILESPDMARAVSELQQEAGVSARDILESRTILTSPDIDLIGIEFVHPDPQTTIAYANAYGKAYEAYRVETMENAFESAISGLDSSIEAVEQELAAVNKEIDSFQSIPGGDTLVAELEDAIESFLNGPTLPDTPEQFDTILNQLQTIQIIRALEDQNPNLALLLENRREIMDRRSQLVVRRDQLRTDAALTSTGIVAFSEATDAESSVGRNRVILVAGLLGAIVGVSLAYIFALRNRRFGHRSEPESILRVPMLAEIPEFRAVSSMLVRDDPASRHAEAFRFAASAIAARLDQLESGSESEANSLTVTSALHGEGKTTVVLNVALSLAARGKTVLVVDADFEGQSLTRSVYDDSFRSPGVTELFEIDTIPESSPLNRLASDDPPESPSITELLEGKVDLDEIVVPISLDGGQRIDILPRGSSGIASSDFFGSPQVGPMLNLMRTEYDYVIIDAPALLQVSHSTYLASLTDAAVTVIPHGSLVSAQQEVSNRLAVVGANLVGYVYSWTPRRSDSQHRRSQSLALGRQRASSGSALGSS